MSILLLSVKADALCRQPPDGSHDGLAYLLNSCPYISIALSYHSLNAEGHK